MKQINFEVLKYLLESDDPEKNKRALQYLCSALEGGHRISEKYKDYILSRITCFKYANNVKVRRWLYKLIALLRNSGFNQYLLGQLSSREPDKENKTWACAALFNINDFSSALNLFNKTGLGFYNTPYEVAAYYSKEQMFEVDQNSINKLINSDDILSCKWLSLHFGKNPDFFRKENVIEFSGHNDAEVVEYSMWALYHSHRGGIDDIPIYRPDILERPANVRRWYYRLLARDVKNIYPNFDLVKYAIEKEEDFLVREGLAIEISNLYIGTMLSDEVIRWFYSEKNELVRFHLINHLLKFSRKNRAYHEILKKQEDTENEHVIQLLSEKSRIFVFDKNTKMINFPQQLLLGRSSMRIPQIIGQKMEHIYILAVDTKDFSDSTNEIQLQFFKDLLDIFNDEDILKYVVDQDLVTLITGDGLIIAFKDVKNRFMPLKLALSALRKYSRTRKSLVRFGVNIGPVYWVKMSDNSYQLIGHSVNWAVRVMSAADPNKILISNTYYDEIIYPSLDEFTGYRFSQVTGLKTKKKEPINAYWRWFRLIPNAWDREDFCQG